MRDLSGIKKSFISQMCFCTFVDNLSVVIQYSTGGFVPSVVADQVGAVSDYKTVD